MKARHVRDGTHSVRAPSLPHPFLFTSLSLCAPALSPFSRPALSHPFSLSHSVRHPLLPSALRGGYKTQHTLTGLHISSVEPRRRRRRESAVRTHAGQVALAHERGITALSAGAAPSSERCIRRCFEGRSHRMTSRRGRLKSFNMTTQERKMLSR